MESFAVCVQIDPEPNERFVRPEILERCCFYITIS